MDSLAYYAQVVEKAIAQIGLNPEDAKIADHKWSLKKGSVSIWVELYTFQNRPYFQVAAPIMEVPSIRTGELAIELLKLNNDMFGVAFVMHKERIYLKGLREAEGLDVSEAYSIMLRVGNYADKYDDGLKERYPNTTPGNMQFVSLNLN